MVITIDMGNTNIFLGVYEDGTLVHTFRTLTDRSKSYDEYLQLFRDFIKSKELNNHFEGAILCSVVPSLTVVVSKAIRDAFITEVKIVGPGMKTGLQVKTNNPCEVGTDLISVSVGALAKYGKPCLIADLGTASKILLVDKEGCFSGVVVMPGIMISAKALANTAAQLSETSLEVPPTVLGRNTVDAMNSGSIYGTVAQIKGLCEMIEKEIGYNCQKILTGGYAPLIKTFLDDFQYDRNLILDGLYKLYEKNRKEK